ncbi:MAG: ATP-binding cassette domain-containing protein [Chloroflexi bacterium]|nr:ATP-binding cassette domain-containing protein [Chloroflexota bacterium]
MPEETGTEGTKRRLEAVDVGFRVQAARLLSGVCLSARKGEFIGLIGPNGAGKTTLLRAISGILAGTEGTVHLEGRALAELGPKEIARLVAQVPQSSPADQGFTSLEMVLMGRYPHLGRFQLEGDTDIRLAKEAMAFTETSQFAERPVSTLSGGERQRLLIARALAQEPCLLLLDEPTANLDIHHQIQVLELVRVLTASGLTAIAAIHDLPLAARYCDRLVLLHRGHVLAEGTATEVLVPGNIREAFGVEAAISTDPLTGSLVLSILAPGTAPAGTAAKGRVHVIAGGGRGARIMYLLQSAGYQLTAGPLGEGDTDHNVAGMLAIQAIAIPAFSAIDQASHREHCRLIAEADCVVLCDIPFGTGNLLNLEAAACARNLVLLEDRPIAERDYTSGAATSRYSALAARADTATTSNLLEIVERILSDGKRG